MQFFFDTAMQLSSTRVTVSIFPSLGHNNFTVCWCREDAKCCFATGFEINVYKSVSIGPRYPAPFNLTSGDLHTQ